MLKHVQSPYRSSSSLGRRCDSSPSSPSIRSHPSSTKSRSSTSQCSSPKRRGTAPTSPTTSSTTSGSSMRGHSGRRDREDTRSLSSAMSCSSEEELDTSLSSRGSSSSSLHRKDSTSPCNQESDDTTYTKTTVKVWVRCLLQEMEYKTLSISYTTSSRDVVHRLLSKYRMKHRDPNLFYLAMEVTATNKGCVVKTCLTLDDEARPAQLVACHPRGDSKLALKMRHGGVVRVYDGILVQGSQYKSLLVSDRTNCLQLLHLILSLNNVQDNVNNYSIFEVRNDGTERRLQSEERPLRIIDKWKTQNESQIVVRSTPQPPQSMHQAHARVTPIPTLRSALNNSKPKQSQKDNNYNSYTNNKSQNKNRNGRNLSKNIKLGAVHSTSKLLSNLSLDSSYSSNFGHFSPSTTITISSDGISTVQNNSSMSLSTSDERPSEVEDDPPSPPLRAPRRGVIANPSLLNRRQLPWTGSGDLLETPVDDDDSSLEMTSPARTIHSYNDYENYFYI